MRAVCLYAPRSYAEAPEVIRRVVVNGCGVGGWKGKLVPDTIWGLSIREACNIHDWMYHEGETIAHKEEADRTFLNNMLRLIDSGAWWLRQVRRNRAYAYYLAVARFGGPAFWDEKNPQETEYSVALKDSMVYSTA